MGKGGYHGGSSIVRLGPGGTSWDSGRDDAGKVVRRRKKKPKQAKPKTAAPKSPPVDTDRARLIEGFLVNLARERTLKKPESNPPKKLKKEVEAAGGVNEWVRADSKRHAFYIQEAAKARAKHAPPADKVKELTVNWIRSFKRCQDCGEELPLPPRHIRPAIETAGGNAAFIAQFEKVHGVVPFKQKAKGAASPQRLQ